MIFNDIWDLKFNAIIICYSIALPQIIMSPIFQYIAVGLNPFGLCWGIVSFYGAKLISRNIWTFPSEDIKSAKNMQKWWDSISQLSQGPFTGNIFILKSWWTLSIWREAALLGNLSGTVLIKPALSSAKSKKAAGLSCCAMIERDLMRVK